MTGLGLAYDEGIQSVIYGFTNRRLMELCVAVVGEEAICSFGCFLFSSLLWFIPSLEIGRLRLAARD